MKNYSWTNWGYSLKIIILILLISTSNFIFSQDNIVSLGLQSGYRVSDSKSIFGVTGTDNYFISDKLAVGLSIGLYLPPSYVLTDYSIGLKKFIPVSDFNLFAKASVGLASQIHTSDIGKDDHHSTDDDIFDKHSRFAIQYSAGVGVWLSNYEIALNYNYSILSQYRSIVSLQFSYLFK